MNSRRYFFLLILGFAIVALGAWVFRRPHHSDVMLFRVVWVGLLPIPIPLGLFATPHFWGGLIVAAGLVVTTVSLRSLRK